LVDLVHPNATAKKWCSSVKGFIYSKVYV